MWFLQWWKGYKARLEKEGYNVSVLPPELEAFVRYIASLDYDADMKRRAVRFLAGEYLGIQYKNSKKNRTMGRWAKKLYARYLLSSTAQPTPKNQLTLIEYIL